MTISVDTFDFASFPRNSKTVVNVEITDSILGTETIPAFICRGTTEGSVLFAVAGVHGDEFEGMRAIQRVYNEITPEDLKGTFIGLPMCNPWAFVAQTRETPSGIDGKNLARVFPGRQHGTPTERLAAGLFELVNKVLTPEDLFVDLHSGGTRYRYLPMVGHRDIPNSCQDDSLEASRSFGIPNIWRIPGDRGPFNSETSHLGIPTVAAEITGQGECIEEDVQLYKEGILNLLRYKHILTDLKPPYCASRVMTTDWLVTTSSGFLESQVQLGEWVKEGQTLGSVFSLRGDLKEVIVARHEGQVWAKRTFATVWSNDIAFLVAHE